MPGVQLTCPHCLSTLNFGQAVQAGATLPCMICNRNFTVRGAAAAPPPGSPVPSGKAGARQVGAAAPPRAAVARHASPPSAAPIAKHAPAQASALVGSGGSSGSGGRMLVGGLLVVIALLMLGGLAYLAWTNVFADRLAKDDKETPPVVLAKGPGAVKEAGNPTPPVVDTTEPKKPAAKEVEPAKTKEPKLPPEGGEEDVANLPKKDKVEKPPVLTQPKVPPPDEEKPITPPPTVDIVVPAEAPSMAAGVDAKRVDAAIAAGIRHLKERQGRDGSWQPDFLNQIGYTSLCGLALLECKIQADDPAVRKAAEFVRANVGNQVRTYDLSTGILFLDRVGDVRDRDLIRKLSLYLAAAQNPAGGWGYKAFVARPTEPAKLQAYLRTHWPWSAARPKPMTGGKPGLKEDEKAALPKVDLQKMPVAELRWNQLNPYMLDPGDNSNTQFAMLALWAARRHDVPTECPLLLTYQRFLTTQTADGGWVYKGAVTLPGFPPTPSIPAGGIPGFVAPPGFNPGGGLPGAPMPLPGVGGPMPLGGLPPMPPGGLPAGPMPPGGLPAGPPGVGMPAGSANASPTMTCVGLLGLALGYGAVPAGVKDSDKEKLDNPAIKKGLDTLAQFIGTPSPNPKARPAMQNLYLLWSIERVGVLYDLKTIGGKDWYGWGAQILLANQQQSGGWGGGGPNNYTGASDVSDTSFALLFLKRANLMSDLTEHLRLNMVIRDPGAK